MRLLEVAAEKYIKYIKYIKVFDEVVGSGCGKIF